MRSHRAHDSPAFRLEWAEPADGRARLRITGALVLRDAAAFSREVRRLPPDAKVVLDLAGLTRVDAGTAALLVRLASARGTGDIVGASGQVAAMLALVAPRGTVLPPAPPPTGLLEQIGGGLLNLRDEAKATLGFLGDAVVAAGAAIGAPRSVRWRDVAPLMERAGAEAVPIVALVNFLVGLILGFQAAVQLRQVGGSIFVADLVGIAMTRELGPLMTAIVVTGRSGAAFAAELGTMAVNEEVDALETLGLDPHRFLVLPRTLALVLVAPLLTVIADVMGILGGLGVGVGGLDLTALAYLTETRQALTPWDVGSGLLKSVVFALIVALVACGRGLATRGGAAGVGRSTTAAVVSILFLLVAADAVFTALFHVFGR
ncbi:MAG TPA: MlaE family lipid ABC transporter permease subunit [Thermodesulfobacteriota bacterium]